MTFLTDVMKKGYSEEEMFAVLVKSDQIKTESVDRCWRKQLRLLKLTVSSK